MITAEDHIYEKAMKIRDSFDLMADHIDSANIFPTENLKILKDNKLMGLLIPKEYGGEGKDIKLASDIAQILASGCLSSSIIWGMHCQQVMTIINHATKSNKEQLLTKIVKEQTYLGSVTSEIRKGGHLLTAQTPLYWHNPNSFELNRLAPTVTGGEYADAFLITVKKQEESNDKEVLLIFAESSDLIVSKKSSWNALGMRGTQSVGLNIEGKLTDKNILSSDKFSDISKKTMIPFGHIIWASSWLGATKNVYTKMISLVKKRDYIKKFDLDSDLLYHRLSDVRIKIDTVDSYLKTVIDLYDGIILSESDNYKSNRFNIHINNLKIIASENLFNAVNGLVEIGGFTYGYVKNKDIALERAFRDLRAASLMFNSDRLKFANGRQALYDSNLLPSFERKGF